MRFVGEHATKVDGATMCALEARSPFLDQELWENAAVLPSNFASAEAKAVLRAGSSPSWGTGRLGRKRGFGIPVQRWIVGRWRTAVEESLRDSLL